MRWVPDAGLGAERELLLIKVQAPPGQKRTEVLQLGDIFRARVVDCGDVSLTLCVTGDAGRVRTLSCQRPGALVQARSMHMCVQA